MSQEVEPYRSAHQGPFTSAPFNPAPQPEPNPARMRKRIDFMASHMFSQLKEHEAAQKRTAVVYEELLCLLEEAVVTFQQSFLNRNVPVGNIYSRIDADRSVGILHVLWHTISFVCRNNTRPMALRRNGREPLFSGRIVALLGDYQDQVSHHEVEDYPDILDSEIASLYIPASPTQPAVMRFNQTKEELFFHQDEAAQQFLLKLLEAVCGGGYFHETAYE